MCLLEFERAKRTRTYNQPIPAYLGANELNPSNDDKESHYALILMNILHWDNWVPEMHAAPCDILIHCPQGNLNEIYTCQNELSTQRLLSPIFAQKFVSYKTHSAVKKNCFCLFRASILEIKP